MPLDSSSSSVLTLLALGVAVVALGVAMALAFRLSKLNRGYALLESRDGADTFVEVVARNVEAMDDLRDDVGAMRSEIKRLRYELGDAVRHVSVANAHLSTKTHVGRGSPSSGRKPGMVSSRWAPWREP